MLSLEICFAVCGKFISLDSLQTRLSQYVFLRLPQYVSRVKCKNNSSTYLLHSPPLPPRHLHTIGIVTILMDVESMLTRGQASNLSSNLRTITLHNKSKLIVNIDNYTILPSLRFSTLSVSPLPSLCKCEYSISSKLTRAYKYGYR